jgi:Zn finger protein HypA/HybF involved in hydrogenase expression
MVEHLSRAALKRLAAARARRLASTATDANFVASLIRYAEECENDAVLLDRQIAQLRGAIIQTRGLATEMKQLAEDSRRKLAEVESRAIIALRPSAVSLLAQSEAFECLDCGQVSLRSPANPYECPACSSLESIIAEGSDNERM